MAAYTEFQGALYNFVIKVLPDTQFVWSYGNGTEPSKTYCAMHLLSIDEQNIVENSHSYSEELDTLVYSTVCTYEALVQFSFRGSEAGDLIHSFKQKLNSPYFWEFLSKNNLSYMRHSNIRHIPQKRDTVWIDGFNIDVTFAYAYLTQLNVDPIEQVVLVDKKNDITIKIPENIG